MANSRLIPGVGIVEESTSDLLIPGSGVLPHNLITAAVGTATETDSALSLARIKIRSVGVATETDTAYALTGTQIPIVPAAPAAPSGSGRTRRGSHNEVDAFAHWTPKPKAPEPRIAILRVSEDPVPDSFAAECGVEVHGELIVGEDYTGDGFVASATVRATEEQRKGSAYRFLLLENAA